VLHVHITLANKGTLEKRFQEDRQGGKYCMQEFVSGRRDNLHKDPKSGHCFWCSSSRGIQCAYNHLDIGINGGNSLIAAQFQHIL
jgi:hypothetical protein